MCTHCAQIIAAKSKSSTFGDDIILYYLILGRSEELLSHTTEELLSHKKPTAQSDTSWFGHSWRAVDGDKNVTYWNSLVIFRYVFNLNLISARFKL